MLFTIVLAALATPRLRRSPDLAPSWGSLLNAIHGHAIVVGEGVGPGTARARVSIGVTQVEDTRLEAMRYTHARVDAMREPRALLGVGCRTPLRSRERREASASKARPRPPPTGPSR